MTTTAVADAEARPQPEPRRANDRQAVAAWVLLALLTAVTCWSTARADYRAEPLVGDAASQLLQAESFAYDEHDVSYDRQDLLRFEQEGMRWQNTPYLSGLFYQRTGQGWAAAKPYGYSLVLAPLLRTLGPAVGVAVTNTILLLALEVVVAALLLLRLRGPAVPLVTAGVVLVSNTVAYAYSPAVDVFTAVLVGVFLYGTLRGLRDGRWTWTALGFAAAGLMLAEKAPLAVVVAPVALVALARQPSWWRQAALTAVAATALAVAVQPYLAASDGASFSPYGGERYYSSGPVPFGDEPSRLTRVDTDETFSLSYVRSAVTSGWVEKLEAMGFYLIGRHTGLAVFMPVALVVFVLAAVERRRLDTVALAVVASLVAYILLYTVLFPRNYFGGGQALGNRYFVQVCALVPALAAVARVDGRRLAVGALGALVLGTVVLWPHLNAPQEALGRMDRTTPVQRLFPFDGRANGSAEYFRCGWGRCAEGGGPEVGEVRRAGSAVARYVEAVTKAERDAVANPAPAD